MTRNERDAEEEKGGKVKSGEAVPWITCLTLTLRVQRAREHTDTQTHMLSYRCERDDTSLKIPCCSSEMSLPWREL